MRTCYNFCMTISLDPERQKQAKEYARIRRRLWLNSPVSPKPGLKDNRLWWLLIPLILAVVLAYVLSPGVRYLEGRLKLSRTAATLLVYLLLVGVLIVRPWGIFGRPGAL